MTDVIPVDASMVLSLVALSAIASERDALTAKLNENRAHPARPFDVNGVTCAVP